MEKPSFTYAGIGSRQTPLHVMEAMTRTASRLEARGYVLHSGGADGADKAFAAGCGRKRIFTAKDANTKAVMLAKEIHPAPHALKGFALQLMARNGLQVFGQHLDAPVDFVLCWTPDAVESHYHRTRATGGTGQAISLASLKGVPVINMAKDGWDIRVAEIVGK